MPKTLMLMRHGQYTSGETMLNITGQQQVDDVAKKLANAGLIPDVILHSPTERAAETALRVRAIFNCVSGKDIPLCICPGIADKLDSHTPDVTDAIDNKIETALVVSHLPNIYALIGEMFGKVAPPHHAKAYVLEADIKEWSGFRGRVTAEYCPAILSR